MRMRFRILSSNIASYFFFAFSFFHVIIAVTDGRDIVYSTCSKNLVRTEKDSKWIDPLLKLYYDEYILIVTGNIDVDNNIANGAVGNFKGATLKDNISMDNLNTIIIYIRCVNINNLKYIKIELIEDLKHDQVLQQSMWNLSCIIQKWDFLSILILDNTHNEQTNT